MKTNRFITLALSISLAVFGNATVFGQAKETITVPLSDPSKPGSLKVNLLNGSIRISGYAGKEVVIEATGKVPEQNDKPKDENAAGMRRIVPSSGLELTATEENNSIKITSRFVNKPMNLHIKVPQKFALKASTVNDGDIIVENVDGELEVANVNGEISLTNVSGSAVANTINGTLKATFKTVDAKSPMAFSTLNGNVDVTLPATAKFDVKLKSDRGEIYSDFDVEVDKSQPQATRTSKDGMFKVSLEDWVKGKVNGGGSEIMMKNMNGNIYVRKAK
ncbi:DUF4097 family beta strand repeat-containing protein [Dyadobacter sp. Leaf189]|uniref:DUF4097 family beta strand repeat-containing protein n=1 Tax=Dyadobacter sp. Leaf189 TaxID=1736295 RepID=UPI000701E48E|nr:DUF4097 family beta strand repeat-containing protein [Dyadobacter sp. Leaf189]KQS28176.1 hypothetical protein ASG33_17485 [Dyadobacter sp. Leaf189]